jgi:hypothetical protein
MIVRGGTVTIKDSDLQQYISADDLINEGITTAYQLESTALSYMAKRFNPNNNTFWGSGNNIAWTTLTLGCQTANDAYCYPTTVNLEGTNTLSTLIKGEANNANNNAVYENKHTCIYIYGYKSTDSASGSNTVTLNISGNTTVNGGAEFAYANSKDSTNVADKYTLVDNATFTKDYGMYVTESPAIVIANRTMNDTNVVAINGDITVNGAIFDVANNTATTGYTKAYRDAAVINFATSTEGVVTITVPAKSADNQ